MIAVTGASGQLGRLVIEHLLTKVDAAEIVAVVRTPDSVADLAAKGVQVRAGDYNRPETLEAAFQGVSNVLLISSNDIGNRIPQHKAVIDAASKAKVAHFVYTSVLNADRQEMGLTFEHPPTEAALKDSGLPYTILRNGWYTENFTDRIQGAAHVGSVVGAGKDGRVSAAPRTDYAEAAAIVLTNAAAHEGKTYELAGDASFSLPELAALISNTLSKDIGYADVAQAEYEKILLDLGLPGPFAAALAEADTATASGLLESDSKDLSALLGRATTPISALVTTTLNS